MRTYGIHFWRSVPLLRLLIPLATGIIAEKYLPAPVSIPASLITAGILILLLVRLLPPARRFTMRWLTGSTISMLMLGAGILLMHWRNTENDPAWLGRHIQESSLLSVTLQEDPVEKPNSYKALAKAEYVWQHNRWIRVKGKLLIYFKKDSIPFLQYGSQLVIQKTLQAISNSGNPGGFDYRQYCAAQAIYHQVYLLPENYRVLPGDHCNDFTKWLLATRNKVLSILRKYIPGEKESGVAEALLIGYRNDLDKDLVRSYSNTGVVHIIAISGLHLGMIYGLMLFLLKPFSRKKWIRWARPVFILAVLWGFSLLAGAAASILRSAVMFTFIVLGESLRRKTQVYNTLAASAFCILLYDPDFLWDVGFQLSYLAVLSIMLFMKPIYRQVYCSNKLLNAIWQLNAITLSAQVLTLPVILLYFHQFPNLFLFTNFIAVPLSGFILYGELVMLLFNFLPWLNMYIGKAITFLITQMNGVIERTDTLPYAVTDAVQFNFSQTCLLYLAITCLGYWLLQKRSRYLTAGIGFLAALTLSDMIESIQEKKQHVLIVYNIPKYSSVDIVEGNRYRYIGDKAVQKDRSLQDFHLQPSRIRYGAHSNDSLRKTIFLKNVLIAGRSKVLFINGSGPLPLAKRKISVDLIIIGGNPRLHLSQLANAFDCSQYVFDSSNPLWKIRYWKKDADNLHLRHHSVPEKGAFIMDL
jgi:competence protein ComEC